MTPRQIAFAVQYALDHNGTAAAVRGGYAEVGAHVTASRLLRKPKVAAVVAAHEADAAERLGLTRERVLEGLRDALEMARQQNNPVAMVAALRESAKISGFYAPERRKVEISVDGARLQAQFAAMSDQELLALAEGRPLDS
jgi:phage terminase small subunit